MVSRIQHEFIDLPHRVKIVTLWGNYKSILLYGVKQIKSYLKSPNADVLESGVLLAIIIGSILRDAGEG